MAVFVPFAFIIISLFTTCNSRNDVAKAPYSIIKRHILPETIDETSGLISYNNLLWTFNDSGGKPEIYGFDANSDSIKQIVTLKNAINKDWEDIAQDEKCIYIGDFGNNMGNRDTLVIYRIKKSDITASQKSSVVVDKIRFTYPNYTPSKLPISFSAFDCEAFVATKDGFYLFSKDWTSGTCTIYTLPKDPGVWVANKVNKFNSSGLITGADYRNGILLLIGYQNFTPFIWRFETNDIKSLIEKNGKRMELKEIATYQTEGICFYNERIFISSERTRSPAQIIEMSFSN